MVLRVLRVRLVLRVLLALLRVLQARRGFLGLLGLLGRKDPLVRLVPLVLSQDPPGLRVRQRVLGLPDLLVQLDLPGRLVLRGQLVLRVVRALPGHKAI